MRIIRPTRNFVVMEHKRCKSNARLCSKHTPLYNLTTFSATLPSFKMTEHVYDVIICGGGPFGLLLSYQLARLGLTIFTAEQFDKTQSDMYGRASTLYLRTIEMLDQIGHLDEMSQVGFIARVHVTFKEGQRVYDSGWDFVYRMTDTHLDYCLDIRQKYSEDIFRHALEQQSGKVNAGWTLNDFTIMDTPDDHKIFTHATDRNGAHVTVKSKYIVGTDGGRSTVRRIANISFTSQNPGLKWVRIDAVIKTDMPESRIGSGAVESPTHSNVIWVALDHGRSRIGFALPKALSDIQGDNIIEEIAKQEAIKSMASFNLEFVSVDW
jgi:phenol 2-monooxygenase